MSKGSKVVPVRIPSGQLDLIEKQIASTNERRFEAPLTLSDFIRIALAEKLAKMKRSATGKRKSKDTSTDTVEVK